MKISKSIISIAVAASMVGAAGYVYAQQTVPSTDGSTTNRDGSSAGTNNPNITPGAAGGAGTTDSRGRTNRGMNNNSDSMSERNMRDGTMRDGTMRDGTMSNRTMRDGTGAVGQVGERAARADRN